MNTSDVLKRSYQTMLSVALIRRLFNGRILSVIGDHMNEQWIANDWICLPILTPRDPLKMEKVVKKVKRELKGLQNKNLLKKFYYLYYPTEEPHLTFGLKYREEIPEELRTRILSLEQENRHLENLNVLGELRNIGLHELVEKLEKLKEEGLAIAPSFFRLQPPDQPEIVKLKSIATQILEENFPEGISPGNMERLLHFLLNASGYLFVRPYLR